MKPLKNFTITPFTRIAWVSKKARQTWENVINDCSTLVQKLEIKSVAAKQRRCSWQTIKREMLPKFSMDCANKGLVVLPVQFVGSFEGFIHYTPPGDCNVYCIIAQNIEDALSFQQAFLYGDHATQGEMLGFPRCCRESFARNWSQGIFDPIWQTATRNITDVDDLYKTREGVFSVKTEAHPYSNPLLRYMGLRVGFHIPHSLWCEETIDSGTERLTLAEDSGSVKLLEHLLSMPMEASLFHGILTVRTPIFYLITYSVPTIEKYVISVKGRFIPKEGIWQEKAKNL